ncbi:MAG: dTDP-4-dehydrorhamnose reductase [Chloroflexota bacterium]
MRILLLGSFGQVGWELRRSLAPLGEVIAPVRPGPVGLTGDLSDLDGLANTVDEARPDIIVNAAAFTDVDAAEDDPEQARLINAQAPGVLGRAAERQGAVLVHYSTDYVFDGTGREPWTEGDETRPVNVYGRTKLEGEESISASAGRHMIFRTSWVFSARRRNFLRTMLRLAQERDQLQVVNDQFGAPTSAELVADVTAHAVRMASSDSRLDGIYHLAARGETTWYDYARLAVGRGRELGMLSRITAADIYPVASEAFPTRAPRPHNSRLDTAKLETAFQLELPPWTDGVERALNELASEYGATREGAAG